MEGQTILARTDLLNQRGLSPNTPAWMFGYSQDLNGQSLASITLPNKPNIGILAMTLT